MGQSIDSRSDIYSPGVVLYQMITGEVPYKADTPMGVKESNEQKNISSSKDVEIWLSQQGKDFSMKVATWMNNRVKVPNEKFTNTVLGDK